MSNTELIPSLFSITLIIVLVAAVIGLAYFMRKRSNRHPMDSARGRADDERRDQAAREQRR